MVDAILEAKYEPILFSEWFKNSNPVEMEIGCGRGKFLSLRAKENPGINFIGIDRVGKWMKRVKTRTEKNAQENLRFIKAEARAFLKEAVADASVHIFHVYFPDPWPKRRHRSRRMVNADFLKLLASKLPPRGLIEIATDDEDYFQFMKKAVGVTQELWENVRETQGERIWDKMNKTNYELRFETAGKPLFYLELKKR